MEFQPPQDDSRYANRYRILSRLSAGGMGETFRAWDLATGRPVVIKRPKPELADNGEILARFVREAEVMRSLEHSHIMPVLEFGTHDGIPFVVMPFLPGGTLAQRRQRGAGDEPLPMPPAMLHLWLPAIAAAIDVVHAHGLIHRDVKPSNIFFDARWAAVLGDFGIVKFLDDSFAAADDAAPLTSTHMTVGTWDYMAPERMTPRARFDGAADQYALGVTVYELCSGRRPFTGAVAHIVVEATSHPVPPLDVRQPELPPSLCRAVHRALSKRPDERFGTCAEFARAVLADVPRAADEPGLLRMLCPGCSAILKLEDRYAGQTGTCPRCGVGLVVANDCGALWLRHEEQPLTQQEAQVALPVFEAPITDRQPPPRPLARPKTRKNTSWFTAERMLYGVIGALVAAALFLWVMNSTDWELAAYRKARTTVESPKISTAAKERAWAVIGRYHCLVKQWWDEKGLAAYAQSDAFGFGDCARDELAVRRGERRSAGGFENASKWWYMRNTPTLKIVDPVRWIRKQQPLERRLKEFERNALRMHVKNVYLQALRSDAGEADREAGRRLFDSDKEFQALVGHKRP